MPQRGGDKGGRREAHVSGDEKKKRGPHPKIHLPKIVLETGRWGGRASICARGGGKEEKKEKNTGTGTRKGSDTREPASDEWLGAGISENWDRGGGGLDPKSGRPQSTTFDFGECYFLLSSKKRRQCLSSNMAWEVFFFRCRAPPKPGRETHNFKHFAARFKKPWPAWKESKSLAHRRPGG